MPCFLTIPPRYGGFSFRSTCLLGGSKVSRGQQIIADIKLIRAAVTEQGDRLQKLPRQPVWVIHRPNGKSYRLTYQPAPLSGWAIHPPDSDASYLLGVIDPDFSR